jgi:hypothetical protein
MIWPECVEPKGGLDHRVGHVWIPKRLPIIHLFYGRMVDT